MAEKRVERRLVTILAADAVGYSRLMGEDEEGTLAKLKASREIIDGLITQHQGRVFGGAGDSVIAEFASPVEAVRCAAKIQLRIEEKNAGLPMALTTTVTDARKRRFSTRTPAAPMTNSPLALS